MGFCPGHTEGKADGEGEVEDVALCREQEIGEEAVSGDEGPVVCHTGTTCCQLLSDSLLFTVVSSGTVARTCNY